ncbi:MAG: SDR family oxidoreductase [Rhodovulum sulfidophilum]|uniref:SDR family oxidoreductase n=1 Tax=Rhodovulum sulfidophilum TaxID=35806 RepID=A0A2W5N9I7_RHOSU|nr:MAG: SDR family oxidoreductase [Rhodovulum sulfidophilum]
MSEGKGRALVTGASSGIGAVYADRLAARGHDLILVARDAAKLEARAAEITARHGVGVAAHPADLTDPADLRGVEALFASDPSLSMLVNNAGFGGAGTLAESSVDDMEKMIAVNVTAVTRLAYAAAPAFVRRGRGTIINVASIVAIGPEILNGVYGGTKAFVLAFSRSLAKELVGAGVSVQVVLPGATATGFWDAMGVRRSDMPAGWIMTPETLVDAALGDLDAGAFASIPSLHDLGQWQAWEAAREAMLPNLSSDRAAPRYRGLSPA